VIRITIQIIDTGANRGFDRAGVSRIKACIRAESNYFAEPPTRVEHIGGLLPLFSSLFVISSIPIDPCHHTKRE